MHFPPLPRRRFLQAAVAAASLAGVALPAGGSAPPPVGHRTAGGTLLVLDARRAGILLAFAEAVIAAGNGFPAVAETAMVARIDEELFFTEPAIRDDFLLALDAVDWLPVAWGHFSRLRFLPLPQRRAFIDARANTRIDAVRAAINGLRLVTGLVYYAQPSTWQAMQYGGPHAGLPPMDSEQRAYYRQATGRTP